MRNRPPVCHAGLHALDYYNPARTTADPDGWRDREQARGRRARRRAFDRAARIDRALAAADAAAGGAK
jgi:hypothetical protein